ncbi:ABC transporter substrate-binding protein [Leifsonia shinshuensis]|uniref:ABC transporter substrate-binding protein n=1 Tax=Leifsonia shinshuensis TaxID=150026 RepID=A0A7G6YA95_9MICO|nr:ABC transporter substrate-binding protein [Leifsonia shinshuensis]QNE35410.1 ABC transporter substrate-binding protein [Leifsonia shinshuensis]
MTISRRNLLVGAAAGGLAIASAAALAACTPRGLVTPTNAATGTPRRGGHFTHGISGGGSSDTLSAFLFYSVPDYGRWMAQYDTLFYPDHNYVVQKRLADEFSTNSTADEWTIRIRSGVEFHNGKTLTADDVLATLQMTLDPKTGASAAGIMSIVDLANSSKVDDRTVKIKLTRAAVDFPEMLSAVAIVPADYTEAKPIGTGPFISKNFQPGIRSDFSRNPNYWLPGKPYLDELSIVGFNDENARVNALLSGQISGADTVDFTLVKLLDNRSGVTYLHQPTNSFIPLQMRVDQKPFDDVRVRQAFKLIADRPALNAGAYAGHARLANDLYAPSDPFYAKDLPQRHQDLDKAKHLLKQAGAENLALTLTTTDLGAGVLSLSQLFAAQAKKAGVNISVNKLDSTTFNGPNLGSYTFSPNILSPGSYLYTAQQLDAPVSVNNYTHFKDPEFDSLYLQASAQTDPAKRKAIQHRMQEIQYDRGGLIIAGFYDAFDGHTTKLGGLLPDISGTGLYRYADLWLS